MGSHSTKISYGTAFSAASSAVFGVHEKEKIACSFRLMPGSETDVVYGPASWSVSRSIEQRMWLRNNGFDMDDIDRIERIVINGAITKDDIAFRKTINSKLLCLQLKLTGDQTKWMSREIDMIRKMTGLGFITENNLSVALAMWEHMTRRITINGTFHSKWGKLRKNNGTAALEFISLFAVWKAENDPLWRTDRSGCFDRYAIIAERLKF